MVISATCLTIVCSACRAMRFGSSANVDRLPGRNTMCRTFPNTLPAWRISSISMPSRMIPSDRWCASMKVNPAHRRGAHAYRAETRKAIPLRRRVQAYRHGQPLCHGRRQPVVAQGQGHRPALGDIQSNADDLMYGDGPFAMPVEIPRSRRRAYTLRIGPSTSSAARPPPYPASKQPSSRCHFYFRAGVCHF